MMLAVLMFTGITVSAAHEDDNTPVKEAENIITNETDALFAGLPEETKNSLSALGITDTKSDGLSRLNFSSTVNELVNLISRSSGTPLAGFAVCMGIILLCSVTESIKPCAGSQKLETVQNTVAALCISAGIIVPMSATITRLSEVLTGASGFMMLYVPILAGLMVTLGKESSAGSWYSSMMFMGNLLSSAAARVILPIMNVFLALSVTGAVSPNSRLGGLCESLYKAAKWILTFLTSLFITITSLNTMITSPMDQVRSKALRFTVSSFVPVVGGVLSEALTTFSGSIQMLKAGAGVFVIIASAFIILPVLAECVVWQFSLFLLNQISELTGASPAAGLFKALSKAAGMMTALLLCVLTVFIITTVIILMVSS